MRKIAQQEIQKAIPQLYHDAYNQALIDLLNALRADVSTVVDISLSTGEKIFHSEKVKQVLMNSLYNEIISRLDGKFTV
jgi:hypothetical protein